MFKDLPKGKKSIFPWDTWHQLSASFRTAHTSLGVGGMLRLDSGRGHPYFLKAQRICFVDSQLGMAVMESELQNALCVREFA